MKKSLLSILLAALMLTAPLTMFSCGESDVNAESGNVDNNSSQIDESSAPSVEALDENSAVNERLLIADELPEKNFDNRTFRVLTNGSFAGYDYIDEIIAEDLNGDACNDAVYNRNGTIEDRFGITIECATVSEPHNEVKTIATAGTTDYQIVGFQNYLIGGSIKSGALLNWCDAPYVNLDKPWHNSLANDDATLNGILYGICSDLSTSSMTYTHAIFTNVDLLGKYGYSADDLYTLVKEGKWTLDQLSAMTEQMYIDENGDGTADANDTYGFGYNITNPADVWFTAFGGKTHTMNHETGEFELTFMSDKTVTMFEALYDFHYNNKGYIKYSEQYAEETHFLEGDLVMAPMRFLAAFNKLRNMDEVYTMLPYPKWDEAQEGYFTNADDKFSVFGMPLSVANDMEFISIIFEALCAESYKTVYPVYYDTALKGKYSSDPTTAEMVDLIMAGRAFDFSFEFTDEFNRLPKLFRDMLKDGSKNIASKYRTVEKVAINSIKKQIYPAYDLD